MGTTKRTRFLIDKIDERLGSIENELKFDIISSLFAAAATIVFTLLIIFTDSAKLSILWSLFAIFSGALTIIMIKEYIDDKKKSLGK